MKKDLRDKLIDQGYQLPLIFAVIILILFGSTCTGQTRDSVYQYCKSIGIKSPEIVTAQAIKETGHFNCVNCSLEKNNIFGFRYKKKYLSFENWKQCCDHYLWWQSKYYKGQNYYDFLDCIWKHSDGSCASYASDPNYTNDLKKIVTKND